MIPVTEDTTLYAVWVSPLRVRYETGLPADDPDRARLEKLLPTDERGYRYAGSTDPAYPSAIEVKAPGGAVYTGRILFRRLEIRAEILLGRSV